MNFEEIVEVLNTKSTKNNFEYIQYNKELEEILGKIEQVDHYGGEGEGETYYTVQHFVDHNIYIRLDGFYSSYSGVDFDGYNYTQVTPQEKTITVYE
jgi:hypothetical protein